MYVLFVKTFTLMKKLYRTLASITVLGEPLEITPLRLLLHISLETENAVTLS